MKVCSYIFYYSISYSHRHCPDRPDCRHILVPTVVIMLSIAFKPAIQSGSVIVLL